MIERRLVRQLEKAAGRFRHLRVVMSWAVVWIVAAVGAVTALALNVGLGWYSPIAAPILAGIAGALALLAAWTAMRSVRDYRWVAQQVEDTYPDLRACLLAAVDQRPQLSQGRFSYLQTSVIQQALHHAYANTWKRVVPVTRLLTAHTVHLLAFTAFLAAVVGLQTIAQPRSETADAATADAELLLSENADFTVTIEPGDAEVERGTSLLVLARFTGEVPLEATLIYEVDGETVRLPMNKPLRDPVYGARIAEVASALSYRVEFAGEQTDEYNVSVFEYPALDRADAELTFPSYTSLETRLVQDVRRVSAVEGTKLKLLCYLNKEVAKAKLVPKEGEPLVLESSGDAFCYTTEMTLTESQRFNLELVDGDGRRNKRPPKFVVNVLPNKPPDLKLVQPSRDTQVSPIEELDLKANVWDDYGVNRFGVAYSLGAEEPSDIVIGEAAPAKQRTPVEHLVAFEELGAEPDQLMSYHFWAEDTGPDGQVRRVSSDMFFAEVRHFEEIFREGQQPPGGQQQQQQQQQGNAQQAQELAELQKQIVTATWKVIRRETRDAPTNEFDTDVGLLAESQTQAIAQAQELSQELTDQKSLGFMRDVIEHMGRAFTTLTEAKDGPAIGKLRPALSAEQAAYQALLKLRAREHQVIQSQQQQQSSSSSSQSAQNRSQQQLQQLQLDSDENRYETERTAQSMEEQQDREDRQVLNRLRELAQRQGDLNDRLQELQSALEEAANEEEREEILRQLKRLQEEQQQILRDTEELQERMDQPENQERMAESQEQLQETRDNVRQASEALEEGRVSRALAAGTRAERELEDMKEDFRRRTSNRFSEEMREMRQQARDLDETQEQLSERIEELTNPTDKSTSLRETDDREQIVEELAGQKEKLNDLLDRMRDTVVDAEETEPLLADQLYDSVRDAQQGDLENSLNNARRMLEYGFTDDARREEQQARRGIGNLREGVERAAESVLGDETEALRRAQEALQELTDQINQEISRETGEPTDQDGQSQDGNRQPGERQSQEGDPQEGQRPGSEPSEREPNESEGQQRPGSQPGEQPSESEQQQQSGGRTSGDPPRDSQQQPSDSQQPRQPSSQQANEGEGQQPSQSDQQRQQEGQPNQPSQNPGSPQESASQQRNNSQIGFEQLLQAGPGNPNHVAPLGGEDFREWSDRLRDVEEMIDDPQLRAEAARIRDRARGFRRDLKRHSKEPEWDLVELQVAKPLAELRDRVAEELLRRTSADAIIPLDRDPVPSKYSEQVRKYYERLGAGTE